MSVLEIAGAAVLGIGLGVVTGMPIGVVNVAIVDAAARGQRRFAVGIGVGGALADTVHAAIAFIGVGTMLVEHPAWSKAMAIVAAIVIAGYAVLASRQRERHEQPVQPRRHGVLTGLVLTLPNPAALGAWIAVAAVLRPSGSLPSALALATGVGLGSALWFIVLARWIASLPRDHRVVRALPRIATALLVVVAVIGMTRALTG